MAAHGVTPATLQRPRRRPRTFPLVMIAPAMLLLALFIAYPIAESVHISLGSWDGIGSVAYRGLANYRRLVHDSLVRQSVVTSLTFFLGTVVFTVAIGCLLANAISREIPGARIFKVVWFLPVIIPVSVAGIFWSNAFQPTTGVVNSVLGSVGLGDGHAWLASSSTAPYATIFVAVWTQTGYAMLILLGAMDTIPPEVHEAATLDGVGAAGRLFRITLPNILPMLGTITTLMSVFSFNAFGVIYAMTRGGPGNSTSILPVLVYKQSFLDQDYGYGSATAVVTTLIVGAIGILVLQVFRQRSLDAR
ncbi:sugar ABC transporter permease [Actinoallomurus purpureus]|uniref:carbohydrate ABC transporter permease n=1 Tax=Actinoallomurus purpureus TaxID=478114 RepID=UPI00209355DD|nr:sugar ABC transporter permease [Actinoallomurus purpureus]MCO6007992.1 sugar ABC transporter permease [Actinoallomurus purpureus]